MKTFIWCALSTVLITSCGQSKEEIAAREKQKQDSITLEIQRQVDASVTAHHQHLEDMAIREKQIQDSIASSIDESIRVEYQRGEMRSYIVKLKGELAAAESGLVDLRQFQIGRSADAKANQIAEQASYIEELKHAIQEAEGQLLAVQ